jgi:tetratricopeptide (TPR) repeat protein/O-antigen ligase
VSEGVSLRTADVPFLGIVLLLVAVNGLATAVSLAPRISLWGSPERLQGTLATMSYAVLFLLIISHLRRQSQWRRITAVIAVTGIVVSVYAVLQYAGLDPIIWKGATSPRVVSTLGNPIFLGAYLLFPLFVIGARLLDAIRTNSAGPAGRRWPSISGWSAAIGITLVALFLSASRGPTLGLLAGVLVLAAIGAVFASDLAHRRPSIPAVLRSSLRRSWVLPAVVAVIGVSVPVIVNLPESSGETLRRLPHHGRLTSAFDLQSRTARVRLLLWRGAAEIVISPDPLPITSSTTDQLHTVRAITGYGPETIEYLYQRVFPNGLTRVEDRRKIPDRAHNDTVDALLTTGILGAAATVALFAVVLCRGLEWLGVLAVRRSRLSFLITSIVSAICVVLVSCFLIGKPPLAALSPAGGIVFATFAMTLLTARRGVPPATRPGHWPTTAVLLALISAHFVEIQFGIPTVATRTHFWALLGVFAVTGAGWLRDDVTAGEDNLSRSRPVRGGVVEASIAILISIPVILALGTPRRGATADPSSDLQQLAQLPLDIPGRSGIVLAVLLLTIWVAAWFIAADGLSHGPRRKELANFVGIAVLGVSTVSILHHGWIGAAATDYAGGDVVAATDRAAGLSWLHAAILLLAWLATGVAISAAAPQGDPRGGRRGLGLAAAIIAAALCAIAVSRNLEVILADTYIASAKYHGAADPGLAGTLIDRATAHRPREDSYLVQAALAKVQLAQGRVEAAAREPLFAEAVETLDRAHRLNPLQIAHLVNLGHVYRDWASSSARSDRRLRRLYEAERLLADAAGVSPRNALIHNQHGIVLRLLGRPSEALAAFQRSLEVDPSYAVTWQLVGDLHMAVAETAEDTRDIPEAVRRRAAAAYRRALELDISLDRPYRGLAEIRSLEGDMEGAISALQRYLNLQPNDWAAHEQIATLHEQLGDFKAALRHVRRAARGAPAHERPRLEQRADELRSLVELLSASAE